MKTKNKLKNLALLILILPVIILVISLFSGCSASKKAATVKNEIAPPPSPPPPPPPVPTRSDKQNAVQEEADGEVPFVMVEEMPEFPGGDKALLEYIGINTKYPEAAKKNNIQGKVIVRFCVTSKGGISQVSILRGVDPELDAEAIRVINTLPLFSPGKQGGKAVPVWYMLPITFALNDQPPRFEVMGTDTIYTYTKDRPKFPGGNEAYMKFKSDNLKYSQELKDLSVEGFVIVNFIIGKDGSPSDFKIERGASPSLDAEALRVAKLLPPFEPAKEKGKPVRFRYSSVFDFISKPIQGPDYKEGDPYVVVEEMPMFPGGDSTLLVFIARNTRYPESAKTSGLQGRVIVRFCVTETGGVDRVSILKGVSPDLDAEAIRVVKTLPAFKPGKQGGKPVSVWYMVPITFALAPKPGEAVAPPPPPPPPPAPAGYDEVPVFPGGEVAMYKFINSKIVYPASAKQNLKSGKVYLRFCVNTDGTLSEVSVVKGVEPSLDAEAVRVVQMLPKWKPGKLAGLPVKVYYSVAVTFTLK